MALLARILSLSRLGISNRHSELKLLPLVKYQTIEFLFKSSLSDSVSDRSQVSSYDELKSQFEHSMSSPEWFKQTEFKSLIKESRSDSQVDYLFQLFKKFNHDSRSLSDRFYALIGNMLKEKKFDKLSEVVDDESLHVFVFKRLSQVQLIMKSLYENQRYEDVLGLLDKQMMFQEKNARLLFIKKDQMNWITKSLLKLDEPSYYNKLKAHLTKCPSVYQELTQSSLARIVYVAIKNGDENFANQLLERITDKVLLFNFKVMASIKCNKVEDALRMLEIELGNGSKKQIVSDRLNEMLEEELNGSSEDEKWLKLQSLAKESMIDGSLETYIDLLESKELKKLDSVQQTRQPVKKIDSPYVKYAKQSYRSNREPSININLEAEIEEFLKLSNSKENGPNKEKKLFNLREALSKLVQDRNKSELLLEDLEDLIFLSNAAEDFQLAIKALGLINEESIVHTFISNLVKQLYRTSQFETAQDLFAHKRWSKYFDSTSTLLLMHLLLEQKNYSQVIRVFQSYVGLNKGTISSDHVYPISFSLLKKNNQMAYELLKQFVLSLRTQNTAARNFASVCLMYLAILQNETKYALDHLYRSKFKDSNPTIFHNIKIIGYARLNRLHEALEELEMVINSEKAYLYRYTIDSIGDSLNNEQFINRLRVKLSKLNKITRPSIYDYSTMESQFTSQILQKFKQKFS